MVDVEMTNTSSREIELISVSGPPLYVFTVLDRNGRAAPLTSLGEAVVSGKACYKGKSGETRCFLGGSTFGHPVVPGANLHDVFALSSCVDLSQPNQYSVRLERPDPYTKLTVRSNTITLTVADRK
ncbi:MAG: hypothetical protein QM757_34010 [Paludibaculum sp.]